MFMYSTDSLRAEMDYRRERIRHDFQRPALFRRRFRKPALPEQHTPELRARHAV